MDDIASLIFNIALHSIILFTFLSIFYWNFIINTETDAISILIQDNLIDTISNELNKQKDDMYNLKYWIEKEINKYPKELKYIGNTLHRQLEIVNHEQDDIYENNHTKYKLLNLVILLTFYLIFILIVIVLEYHKYNINYKDIIIENIILIIIIGTIEAAFFHFIASQYVPLTDSDMKDIMIGIINKI